VSWVVGSLEDVRVGLVDGAVRVELAAL
jgi:hypothetical protein